MQQNTSSLDELQGYAEAVRRERAIILPGSARHVLGPLPPAVHVQLGSPLPLCHPFATPPLVQHHFGLIFRTSWYDVVRAL